MVVGDFGFRVRSQVECRKGPCFAKFSCACGKSPDNPYLNPYQEPEAWIQEVTIMGIYSIINRVSPI